MEEVEAGLKGLKVDQEGKIATPFMAEQMEEALNVSGSRQMKKDGDMTAFNKLVSSMKASGTLPSQPKVNVSSSSGSGGCVSRGVAANPYLSPDVFSDLCLVEVCQ